MASLIELSFEPIIIWQPERGILEWNRGAESINGLTREQALNRNPRELLQTRYPVPFAKVMEQLNLSHNWVGEIINTSQDGTSVVIESRYQPIKFEEEILVLETNRDVRERRRADVKEARMVAVADASHNAPYGANLDGIIETWKLEAEKLLGYSGAEIVNRHVSVIAHPERQAEQLQFLAKVKAGETVDQFDTVRKSQDGRLIDVSIAISPVRAADGIVSGISVSLRDIAYRKEWEQGRRIMNLELAHRVKNSFAVLQAILGSTLKSTPDPEQFASAFSVRLTSMAAAHDVLTVNDWRGVENGALLRHQTAQYVTTQRIRLSGAIIELAPKHATPLSLIFNEPANNALKFGALSTPNGRINVTWNIKSSRQRVGMIDLPWIESGGRKVEKMGRMVLEVP